MAKCDVCGKEGAKKMNPEAVPKKCYCKSCWRALSDEERSNILSPPKVEPEPPETPSEEESEQTEDDDEELFEDEEE